MEFKSFFSDVISTIVGGGLLTFIFFLLRERVYKSIDLDGTWVYEQITEISDFNPYIDMKIRYLALISLEGKNICGSAEKIYDRTADGNEREYVGKNRTLVDITGHLEKNYLSKDKISIHIREFGEKRQSSTFHKLMVVDNNTIRGTFSSTVANQQGKAEWIRRSS